MRLTRRPALIVAALLLTSSALAQEAPKENDFTTSDGVKIHYLIAGTTGSWVVLITGYTEALDSIAVERHTLGQHLDGDVTTEPNVAGAIDLAHAPGADWAEDLVAAKSGSCGERHRGNRGAGL